MRTHHSAGLSSHQQHCTSWSNLKLKELAKALDGKPKHRQTGLEEATLSAAVVDESGKLNDGVTKAMRKVRLEESNWQRRQLKEN